VIGRLFIVSPHCFIRAGVSCIVWAEKKVLGGRPRDFMAPAVSRFVGCEMTGLGERQIWSGQIFVGVSRESQNRKFVGPARCDAGGKR